LSVASVLMSRMTYFTVASQSVGPPLAPLQLFHERADRVSDIPDPSFYAFCPLPVSLDSRVKMAS
jgi:hypothetical protein